MKRSNPTIVEIGQALEWAVNTVIEDDGYLIKHRTHERALTHRLACYLERRGACEGWHIDCEYNRQNGRDSKRRTNGALALPDIVVHRRGPDGPNLFAVEAKTILSERTADDDQKLRDYVILHHYRAAYFVAFKPRTIELVAEEART